MNKHVRCVLLFFGFLTGAILIPVGVTSGLDWIASVFGVVYTMIGMSIIMLLMLAKFTHYVCKDW